MLYVIEDVCLRAANWVDAVQPITVKQHAVIQAMIAPPLKEAIAKVSEPLSCDEKLTQTAALLHACQKLTTTALQDL
jgi:hypothetical protein